MQLENSFAVNASPDRVFAYLLDVNKVVGCVPGAELVETVDSSTFKGKVKVKVGPITVAYSGKKTIWSRHSSASLAAQMSKMLPATSWIRMHVFIGQKSRGAQSLARRLLSCTECSQSLQQYRIAAFTFLPKLFPAHLLPFKGA